ncbi:ANTAR domain-containing protein [Streptomyces sp. NPDC102467]|uniref:ANTAR domain-containing protein n=1 Tax=Streptomyces sp. NPDC102467 TaxID=3366179 RepID=UPI00381A8527
MSEVPEQDAAPKLERAKATVARLEEEVGQLRHAADAHHEIGQAVGIIMAVAHATPDQAWDVVRNISQRTNIKLRHIADLLTEWNLTGNLPTDVRTELDRQLRLLQHRPQAQAPNTPP